MSKDFSAALLKAVLRRLTSDLSFFALLLYGRRAEGRFFPVRCRHAFYRQARHQAISLVNNQIDISSIYFRQST